jgi:hypothetical protein
MLGVLGKVPAFDKFFKQGLGVSTFGNRALSKIADFYLANMETIDRHRRPTIDFKSGQPTNRRYTRAKALTVNNLTVLV